MEVLIKPALVDDLRQPAFSGGDLLRKAVLAAILGTIGGATIAPFKLYGYLRMANAANRRPMDIDVDIPIPVEEEPKFASDKEAMLDWMTEPRRLTTAAVLSGLLAGTFGGVAVGNAAAERIANKIVEKRLAEARAKYEKAIMGEILSSRTSKTDPFSPYIKSSSTKSAVDWGKFIGDATPYWLKRLFEKGYGAYAGWAVPSAVIGGLIGYNIDRSTNRHNLKMEKALEQIASEGESAPAAQVYYTPVNREKRDQILKYIKQQGLVDTTTNA